MALREGSELVLGLEDVCKEDAGVKNIERQYEPCGEGGKELGGRRGGGQTSYPLYLLLNFDQTAPFPCSILLFSLSLPF